MKEGIHSISVVNARKLVGKRNAGAQAPVFLYLYMRCFIKYAIYNRKNKSSNRKYIVNSIAYFIDDKIIFYSAFFFFNIQYNPFTLASHVRR
jgi:hypothetical protein